MQVIPETCSVYTKLDIYIFISLIFIKVVNFLKILKGKKKKM